MKKALKGFAAYSFYRRSLFIYALGVVLFTAIILVSLFSAVTYHIKNNAMGNSMLILDQLVSTSDYLKADVDNLISMVTNNPRTLSFIRNKQDNKLSNYFLYRELTNYKASHPYVVDISVVNLDAQVSVQASGTNVDRGANIALAKSLSETDSVILRREIRFTNPTKEYQVVSFLYCLPYNRSAVVVDVDAQRFCLSIDGAGLISRQVAVIDQQGQWVEYPESFPLPRLDQESLEDILREYGEDASYFFIEDPKERLILFFSKSKSLDWWFIDVQSYSRFFSIYTTLGLLFLGVALAFLTVCIVMSAFFGRQIRKPLIRLAEKCKSDFDTGAFDAQDEIQYLDRALARVEREQYLHDQYVNSLYLRSVLLGHSMPFFISQDKQAALRKKYAAPCYSVLLLKIRPEYTVSEGERGKELSLLRYTTCNLAEEIFSKEYLCAASDLGEDRIALLFMLPSLQIGEEYRLCFQTLVEFASKHIEIQLSGALGPVVDEFGDIHFSYAKARQYLDMDNLVGKSELLDTSRVTSTGYQEKNEKLIEAVERYTIENFNDPSLSLKGISEKFGLSATYLGKIFKSVKGVSYSAFVTGYRLEQSKLALLETNKTVSEISMEVGFSNATYFTTVFKNTFGMTPTAYRGNAKNSGASG